MKTIMKIIILGVVLYGVVLVITDSLMSCNSSLESNGYEVDKSVKQLTIFITYQNGQTDTLLYKTSNGIIPKLSEYKDCITTGNLVTDPILACGVRKIEILKR